jgi:hypothetical protein
MERDDSFDCIPELDVGGADATGFVMVDSVQPAALPRLLAPPSVPIRDGSVAGENTGAHPLHTALRNGQDGAESEGNHGDPTDPPVELNRQPLPEGPMKHPEAEAPPSRRPNAGIERVIASASDPYPSDEKQSTPADPPYPALTPTAQYTPRILLRSDTNDVPRREELFLQTLHARWQNDERCAAQDITVPNRFMPKCVQSGPSDERDRPSCPLRGALP